MVRLSRPRWIEIGVALVLTLAALLFVVWKVWAAEPGGVGMTMAPSGDHAYALYTGH